MQHKPIQVTGLVLTATYAVFIIWVYATEPRTFREVANSASVAAGSYQVDQEKFNAALDSAAELKAELEQGMERGWSDLNPLKVLRTRK
jgi:hypothetical protein